MAKRTKKSKKELKNTPIKQKKTAPLKKVPSNIQFQEGFWKKNWLPALLLFVLATVLYAQTINYTYVLDDKIVFTKNQYVKEGFGGIGKIMSTESMQGYFGEQKNLIVGGRYRPLSIATFAMEYQFTKHPGVDEDGKAALVPNPKVSHFINILLYGLTALLLFRVLCLLFPAPENKKWFGTLAFVASLLFVLHPIHSEVVANVKGRDEIMTLIGALGSLYFTLRYLKSDNFIWLGLSSIVFFLALLAKENALTFLAVIPLSVYFFTNTSLKKNLISVAPLLVVAIAYLVLRSSIIGYFLSSGKEITDIMNNPFYGLNVGEKFATIFYTLALYVKLLIFPHPLTHDYYPFHIPVLTFGDYRAILGLLMYIALGVYALYGLFKKDIIAYGILFYLLTLSITSNIPFTVGTFMNERFVYISSIGACIILAYLITRKIPEWMKDKAPLANGLAYGLLALFAIGFTAKKITRVPAWKDTLSLNQAAIKTSKNSARANCFMGTALFEEYKTESDPKVRDQLREDFTYYIDRALEIHPRYGSAMTMKAGVAAENYKKDRNLDKLLDDFYKLIIVKPNLNFIDQYTEYLMDRGDTAKLGNFCKKVGAAFVERGNYPMAVKYYTYGTQATPSDGNMYRGLSNAYQAAGNSAKAQQYLNRAKALGN